MDPVEDDVPCTRFLRSFPKTASSSTLEKKVWWWRFADEESCHHIFPRRKGLQVDDSIRQLQNFKDLFERSAFFYEFYVRYHERYDYVLNAPWINCTFPQKLALRALLPDTHPDRYFSFAGSRDSHWVQLQVNIALPMHTLQRRLKQDVERCRRQLGIKGGHIRTRCYPWMAVEAMDIKRYSLRPLSDSEPSAHSKAKRKFLGDCRHLGIKP